MATSGRLHQDTIPAGAYSVVLLTGAFEPIDEGRARGRLRRRARQAVRAAARHRTRQGAALETEACGDDRCNASDDDCRVEPFLAAGSAGIAAHSERQRR